MFGILRGNQTVDLSIYFAPQKSIEYKYKLRVKSYPLGGDPIRVLDARQPGTVTQATPLQNMHVTIVAPADIGAVVFDPPETYLDVRLVNTEELLFIYIENVSNSDLEYFLRYKMKFTPEPGAYGKTMFDGIIDLELPPAINDKEKTNDTNNTTSSSTSSSLSIHPLFCQEPVGVIGARSRKKIGFVFRPNLAGCYYTA